jgi:hypothetical protein
VGRFSLGKISIGICRMDMMAKSSIPIASTITAIGFLRPVDTNDMLCVI